jgi:hypothetical protein
MASGIIFNSISRFVEQVGRRYVWKYAELDNLTSIWTGPTSGALGFKPRVGDRHPDYPLMFCTDSQITNREALVSEVTATYEGIIQTRGQSFYITPAVTTESAVQGSRDFQIFVTVMTSPTKYALDASGHPIAGYSLPALYNYGTQTQTVRYVGTQCSVRYQAYPRPTGLHYSSLGMGRVKWHILSTTLGPISIAGTGVTHDQIPPPQAGYLGVPPLIAANLGVELEQRGQWYNCTEIYGPTF